MGIKFNAGKFVQGVGNAVYDYSKDQQKRQDTLDEDARRYQQQKELIDYREQADEGTYQKRKAEGDEEVIATEEAMQTPEYGAGLNDEPVQQGGKSEQKQKLEKQIIEVSQKLKDPIAGAAVIMWSNKLMPTKEVIRILKEQKVDPKYIDMIDPQGDILDNEDISPSGLDSKPKKRMTKAEALARAHKRKIREAREDKDYDTAAQVKGQKEVAGYSHGLSTAEAKRKEKLDEGKFDKNIQPITDDKDNVIGYVGYNDQGVAKKFDKPPAKTGQRVGKPAKAEKQKTDLEKIDLATKFNTANHTASSKMGQPPEESKRQADFAASKLGSDYEVTEQPLTDEYGDVIKDETGNPKIWHKVSPKKTQAAQQGQSPAPQVPTVPDDIKGKFNDVRKQNPNARLMYNPSTQQYVIQ